MNLETESGPEIGPESRTKSELKSEYRNRTNGNEAKEEVGLDKQQQTLYNLLKIYR